MLYYLNPNTHLGCHAHNISVVIGVGCFFVSFVLFFHCTSAFDFSALTDPGIELTTASKPDMIQPMLLSIFVSKTQN